MHRKSLEAADQLKDDNTTTSNQSDKEGDDEDDNDEDNDDDEDDDDDDNDAEDDASSGHHTTTKNDSSALKKASLSASADDAESHKLAKDEKKIAVDDKADKATTEGGGAHYQNSSPRHSYVGESPEEAHLRIRQEIQTQMEQHHAAVMQLAASSRTDPEEFRNNSIACLRAKAQEHSAKIFSLSADALMLVNNNAAAFLHRSSLGNGIPAPHYDANANNLPNIHNYYQNSHHQVEMTNNDMVTSSDSSPIF